jgi:FkbM family methyltransferase
MIRAALARVIRNYIYYTPPHPGRGILGKVAHRLQPQGFPAEVVPGVKFNIRLNILEEFAYWQGWYETQGEIECFRALLRPGMTVFDVGANHGMYALAAVREIGPTGHVYGFEAVPAIMTRFRENITLNGVTNVTAVPAAVSDRVGKATFYPDESGYGTGAGSLVRQMGKSAIDVETVALDGFKKDRGIGRVGFVKIDVEGAEHLVLDGMQEILRDDRPAMLVEHNDGALTRFGSSAADLFRRIVGYGYDAHLVIGGKLKPVTELQPPLYTATEPCSNYVFTPAQK